jgi:hypothetical protein
MSTFQPLLDGLQHIHHHILLAQSIFLPKEEILRLEVGGGKHGTDFAKKVRYKRADLLSLIKNPKC